MNASDWIAASALFVTLVTLVIQQTRLANSAARGEKRTETKLRIYYLLQDRDRSEGEIVDGVKQATPTEKVDEPEIRKALYEMLKDGTIRYTRENKYKARRRKPTKKDVTGGPRGSD